MGGVSPSGWGGLVHGRPIRISEDANETGSESYTVRCTVCQLHTPVNGPICANRSNHQSRWLLNLLCRPEHAFDLETPPPSPPPEYELEVAIASAEDAPVEDAQSEPAHIPRPSESAARIEPSSSLDMSSKKQDRSGVEISARKAYD